jgi:hypothetical protein
MCAHLRHSMTDFLKSTRHTVDELVGKSMHWSKIDIFRIIVAALLLGEQTRARTDRVLIVNSCGFGLFGCDSVDALEDLDKW